MAIDRHLQHVGVVLDLVGELGSHRDVTEKGANLIPSGARLFDTDIDVAARVVEQLADRLRGDAVVDMDLTDDSLIAGILPLESRLQPVERIVRAPTRSLTVAWIDLPQFGPAVLGVGCRN